MFPEVCRRRLTSRPAVCHSRVIWLVDEPGRVAPTERIDVHDVIDSEQIIHAKGRLAAEPSYRLDSISKGDLKSRILQINSCRDVSPI